MQTEIEGDHVPVREDLPYGSVMARVRARLRVIRVGIRFGIRFGDRVKYQVSNISMIIQNHKSHISDMSRRAEHIQKSDVQHFQDQEYLIKNHGPVSVTFRTYLYDIHLHTCIFLQLYSISLPSIPLGRVVGVLYIHIPMF